MSALPRRLAAFMLLALLVVPLGQNVGARAARIEPPRAAQSAAPAQLPPLDEAEPNNAPQSATPVGSGEQRWSRRVRGAIGGSGDVDYFTFTLTQPASSVRIRLDSLTADYDLLLGGVPGPGSGFDPGQPGLEGVTQVGGGISAIGGGISAIGGGISAIGGGISAIGGGISAIGGGISAISANSGSTPETIDTLLWLPGTYYAVVTPNNGDFGDTRYSLTLEVDGSGLEAPPPAPEVEVRLSRPAQSPAQITTLYIVNSARMRQLYPAQATQVTTITQALDALGGGGSAVPNPSGTAPEFGVVLDISALQGQQPGAPTIGEIYNTWDARAGNPLAANYVAGLIDNLIEAATTDGRSGDGSSAPYYIGPSATSALISFPNVRNVVLVGGDDSIPGTRLPDLTTIANEAEYAAYLRTIDPGGVIDPASPQGAALRYRMITSDGPYGALRPYRFYGFPFYLPRLAVGRLVEQPAEIAQYLANYLPGAQGGYAPTFTIDLRSQREAPQAFVSGYDFLQDQAGRITQSLTRTGLLASEINTLIGDEWTSADLTDGWFDGPIDTRFPDDNSNDAAFSTSPLELFSVNTHFDHWQVLPAKGTQGNFPARRLLTPGYTPNVELLDYPGGYFRTTLGYSVGCHSGFNVLGRAILPGTPNAPLYQADFAQALVRHGGNWIGNTGYGYGTADGIDYSERLSTLFTEELARDVREPLRDGYVGQSIGQAFVNARARYVRNSAALSPYDYKALHVMTLYGLPYLRTIVSAPQPPPREEARPSESLPPPAEVQAPATPNNFGRLTRTITFEIDLRDRQVLPRTGSSVLRIDPSKFTVADEFVARGGGRFPAPAVRVFENNQVGAPMLPTFAYDISAGSGISATERLRVRDVVFLGGEYGDEPNFNPQMTLVTTETTSPIVETSTEPRFEAGAGIWYPDKFFGHSAVGEGAERRDQLVAAAAQFRADAGGVTGRLRPYSRMVFQVIYDDPGRATQEANLLRQDNQAPIIESVRVEFQKPRAGAQLAQSNQATVIVRTYDAGPVPGGGANAGIDPRDISAVYIKDGTTWVNVSFTQRDERTFAASLPVSQGAVRVIVRVTDRAGNTSYYTAKGSFQPPFDAVLVGLPLTRR
jgi:hypothetical protein